LFSRKFYLFQFLRAQTIEAKIKIESLSPENRQRRRLAFARQKCAARKEFFVRSLYAGIENLGERISDVRLFDEKKRKSFTKTRRGRILAERKSLHGVIKSNRKAAKRRRKRTFRLFPASRRF
jgi:hypothetical protein